MKKILTIALVALLAAGTAFAGLSGYSNLGFGYNSQSGSFGFSPSSALSVDIDVATADGSNVGEGDIYAGIDGSITLRLVDAATANNQYGTLYMYNAGNDSGYYSLGIFASINSAYIAGNDWKVSFGTASSNPVDFAKSAVDTYTAQLKDVYNYAYWTKSSAISYKAPYASTNGFVAEYKDYKVGIGFVGTKSDDTTVGFTAYALTPEIELGDSAKVKVGAVASKSNEAGKYVSAGASLQGTFAVDEFSAKASADFGLENIGAEKDGNKFHFDAAANFKYDFASLDVYYADFISVQGYHLEAWAPVKDAAKTEYKNLLSVKAAFDLNSFDVPVAITLKGKDLINKQNLSASVDVAVSEAVTVTVGGGYGIKSEKVTVNAGVEYKDEKFTASAKVDFSLKGEDKQLYPTVVVSSDAIVNGATLELSWKPATDGSGSTTTNLLNKDADFGKIYATAKLAF